MNDEIHNGTDFQVCVSESIKNARPNRDTYIDFLRAFGLLLIILAHIYPPVWLFNARCFDVPLMVFISSICCKSLTGGYLAYCLKRFKRIYIPVGIFLTIFFGVSITSWLIIGWPKITFASIIGSYLLLDYPSIGFVWIMRVFLLMALINPLLEKLVRKMNPSIICILAFGIIVMQSLLVKSINVIENQYVSFVLTETVLYVLGYSSIAIIGIKITMFRKIELYSIITISALAILVYVCANNWTFNPQSYKYPPQSLYLLYGILVSCLLWSLKPLLGRLIDVRAFAYLSKNSMWIYLWHIIPAIIVMKCIVEPQAWAVRYIIVLISSIILFSIYNRIEKIVNKYMRHLKLQMN